MFTFPLGASRNNKLNVKVAAQCIKSFHMGAAREPTLDHDLDHFKLTIPDM